MLRPYEESRGSALGAGGDARLLAEIAAQAGADIELKNSMLAFDFDSRLVSNSMASTVESAYLHRGSHTPPSLYQSSNPL